MNWYFEVVKKYAVFAGRAQRKEFWMFFVFNMFILSVLQFVDFLLFGRSGIIELIYSLVILIPTIAVGVRRMHDTDHSGWWLLFPIVNLVFAVKDGTQGDNRFGSDQKVQRQNVRSGRIVMLVLAAIAVLVVGVVLVDVALMSEYTFNTSVIDPDTGIREKIYMPGEREAEATATLATGVLIYGIVAAFAVAIDLGTRPGRWLSAETDSGKVSTDGFAQ